MKGRSCTITNRAYCSEVKSEIGRETELSYVSQWENIEAEATITNIDVPLFSYFKMPIANNIDPSSPLGLSVFSEALEQIRETDELYSGFKWEFEGGELAVDADESLFLKDDMGKATLPKNKKRLFRMVNMDDGKEQLKTFNPDFREQAYINGINAVKRMIEFNCGLAYETISSMETVDKTATEIKASKQRSFALVAAIQKSLQNALDGLIYAMDIYATLYKLAPTGAYEVSYNWDDSIIVDTESEQAIRMAEVSGGMTSNEFYLTWRYGVTPEQAKEIMPKSTALTEE